MKKLKAIGLLVVGLVGLALVAPLGAQADFTTQLALFLRDLRNGTLGVINPITSVAVGDGTAAAPSLTFSADPDTGLFRATSGLIGVVSDGNYRMVIGNSLYLDSAAGVAWSSTALNPLSGIDTNVTRSGAGMIKIGNASNAQFVNINVAGAPTPSSCGDGVLATGSTNTSGRVTSAATMTGCTLTFSTAFPNNSADCIVQNITGTRAGESATASTTALVVAGLTAGDDFAYFCVGR